MAFFAKVKVEVRIPSSAPIFDAATS